MYIAMCIRTFFHFLLLVSVFLIYSETCLANDFLLIVNGANDYSGNTDRMRKTVKKLFFGNQKHWGNNSIKARPLCRLEGSLEENTFNRVVLGMSKARIDSYWLKRKQRYGDSPPDRIRSTKMLIRLVKRSKGAFGVVRAENASTIPAGVRILFTFSSSGAISLYTKPAVAQAVVTNAPKTIEPTSIVREKKPKEIAKVKPKTKLFKTVKLKIRTPRKGTKTSKKNVQLTGTLSGDWQKGSLRVKGKMVTPQKNGMFSVYVSLAEGPNSIEIVARSQDGKVVRKSVAITRVRALTLSLDQGGRTQAIGHRVSISGTFLGGQGKRSLRVGTKTIPIGKNGRFRADIALASAQKTLIVVATAGRERVEKRLKIIGDTHALTLTIGNPKNNYETLDSQILIKGTVGGGGGGGNITLTINGTKKVKPNRGIFSATVPLSIGVNNLVVVANDGAGRSIEKSVEVTRRKVLGIILTQGKYYFSEKSSVTVIGKIVGGIGKWQLKVDGKNISISNSGVFHAKVVVKKGERKVNIKVVDELGSTVKKTIRVVGAR